MKILHIGVGNMYGGIETHLVCLARARALCPELETAFAVCFNGRLRDELHASGASVHRLGSMRMSRPWTVWRARSALRALLTRERFDAVICHAPWCYALLAPVIAKSESRLFLWCHAAMNGATWTDRWARRVRPHGLIANSAFTAQSLPSLFPDVACHVVHCAVASPELGDVNSVRDRVRAELNAVNGTVAILHASRIEEGKGHRVLLKTLAALAGVPNWVCWIAGGPQRRVEQEYFEALKHEAGALKLGSRVRFLGQRSDVSQLLAGSDIVCHPNTGPESFGIAFIEALYAGKPVVTSAIGGALEIVDDSCGVLVAPKDADAVAAALHRLILDEPQRLKLGQHGTVRAKELCDPAAVLKALQSGPGCRSSKDLLKQAFKSFLFAVAPVTATELMSARSRAHSHRLNKEWGVDKLNRKLLQVFGDKVVSGPFAGMRLSPMTHAEHLGPFLLGTYESELHPWFQAIANRSYAQIVDVGAKFGYYAIGLARLRPNIPVVAFDTDRWARKAMAEMAVSNGGTPLQIESYCSPEWLNSKLKDRAFVISDCEGFERELFCSQQLPSLNTAEILIETHETAAPGVTNLLRERYSSTHEIQSVASATSHPPPVIPGLDKLTPEEVQSAITEKRSDQEWLFLTPRK